ncbi:MAG TPA: hypothetical protein VHD56_05420 [Tepidisphaeraceae bacterium]|nr:hypothetical protein [Tepidisphaeraceae bacterium]
MRGFVGGMIVWTGMLLTSVGLAQTTAPATQPIAADQTTPQGTLVILTRAMQSGDSASAKPLLHSVKPDEASLADMLIQSIDVNSQYKKAVAKSFGADIADRMAGSDADETEAEARIGKAKVTISGDSAIVESEPAGDPIKLIQVDGKWKISIASFGGDQIAQAKQQMKIRMDIIAQATTELGQGKFKKVEELQEALDSRLALAMLQASQAQSAAPSQPASAPAMAP